MVSVRASNPKTVAAASLKQYLAHVRRNEDGSFEIHHLEEHLRAVADLGDEGLW